MAVPILPVLFPDPQTLPHRPCPDCGGDTYPPGYACIRCGHHRP